jgi:hypothetical protein
MIVIISMACVDNVGNSIFTISNYHKPSSV